MKIDAYPNRDFPGTITAINPKVDATNRNIQIRATIKNPKHELLPGMYGTVQIAASTPQDYLTVPQTAITYAPYGNTIFIVTDKDSKGNTGQPDASGKPTAFVKQSFVTTGATRGDQVQILSGIAAGDMIVTSGQTKLRNDSPVSVNDSVEPASDANPTPQDK